MTTRFNVMDFGAIIRELTPASYRIRPVGSGGAGHPASEQTCAIITKCNFPQPALL